MCTRSMCTMLLPYGKLIGQALIESNIPVYNGIQPIVLGAFNIIPTQVFVGKEPLHFYGLFGCNSRLCGIISPTSNPIS